MKYQLGIHWHCSNCEKCDMKAVKNEQEIETRRNAFLMDLVSRVNSLQSKVAGLKQDIINSVKSEKRGVSAQAAASEEGKLDVILFNVKERDSNLKDERL